jgi:hypothetical protein
MFYSFGFTSLWSVVAILYMLSQPYKIPLPRNLLTGPIFLVHVAASLMHILMFLLQFIIPVRPSWDHHLVPLFVGLHKSSNR